MGIFGKSAAGLSLLMATSLLAASSAWAAATCYDETKIQGTNGSNILGVPTGSNFWGPMQFIDGGVVSGYGRVIYAVGQINAPSSNNDTNILDNSAQGFENFLKTAGVQPGALVVFHSPGGVPQTGFAIGELIRKYSLRTTVGQPQAADTNSPLTVLGTAAPAKGACISACSLAFLGGIHRTVPTGSLYGVHAVEVTEVPQNATIGGVFFSGQQIAAQTSAYLEEMGVDPSWLSVADECAAGSNQVQFLNATQMVQTRTTTEFTTSWTLQDDSGQIQLVGSNPASSAIPNNSDDLVFGCVGAPRSVAMRVDYLPETYNAGEPAGVPRSSPAAFPALVSSYSLSGFKANSVATSQPTVVDIAKSDATALGAADQYHVTTSIAVTSAIVNLLNAADTLQFSFKGQTAPVGQVNFDLSEAHQFITDYIGACR